MSDLACSSCNHYHQHSGKCGEPEFEDIYVSDSAYGGNRRFYRSMIVDTCQCLAAATEEDKTT